MQMASYKITWKPLSGFSTQLDSDTIFGHFCWALNYLYEDNQKKLKELLMELEKRPALILSSAFPSGKLPKPVYLLSQNIIAKIWQKLKEESPPPNKIDEKLLYSFNKKVKKNRFIERDSLKQKSYQYDPQEFYYLNMKKELHKYLKSITEPDEEEEKSVSTLEFHNRIDRLTGTTIPSGDVFVSTIHFYNKEMESYMDTDLYELEELQNIFNLISMLGFGKDKHTGKGRFEIKVEPFDWGECPQCNAYLNLSNMIPAESDPPKAFYESKTKFAKVGGDFALEETPFKYPLYIIQPGAVFFVQEGYSSPKGSLIHNVHRNPEVVQNLYSYNLPIFIKEE